MNKTISGIFFALLCCLTGMMVSCIEDEVTPGSPECVITAFAVNDIKTILHTTAKDGSDSTYSRTVSGSSVKFNIDQVNGRIYSIDSLPNWVNVDRVVANIQYTGQLYARVLKSDTLYYSIISGRDSLDLSEPLEILVTSTDGTNSKHYTAVINRYSANKDSLFWNKVSNDLRLSEPQKLIAKDGMIYAFAEDGGVAKVSKSADGASWTLPESFSTTANGIKCQSICLFKNKFCAIDNDGMIYSSEDGVIWTQASNIAFKSLLASDSYYLYAFDGVKIIATRDLISWEDNGNVNIDMLPDTNIVALAYPSRTNPDLQVNVLAGNSANNIKSTSVWYKISSSEVASNQKWDYIEITRENQYALPKFSTFAMFHYDDALFAIGDENQVFFRSHDNGITWKEVTSFIFPPKELISNRHIGVTVNGDYIWMVQTSENNAVSIWKGILNRFE